MLHFLVYWATAAIQFILGYIDYYLAWFVDILDYYAPDWRLYVLSPFVITFVILPMLLVVYLYLSALLLFVYYRRHSILDAFHQRNVWEGYRRTMGAFWSGHGWIWHGYEVVGMENIPQTGPALIIYYHGAFPIDLYYLIAHIYLEKGRVIHNVMDNFAFKIPGLAQLFRFWGSFPGPRSRVVKHLKEGAIVSIAPGGVREALFSENYSLVWKNRIGFAKAALEAEVPILPVFTENCRQAFNFIGTGKKIFRYLYERTRWPLMPMYGGFPVKMRTHIGKPIQYNPSLTPEALALKVRNAIEELIEKHQSRPATVLQGIWQRLESKPQTKGKKRVAENGTGENTLKKGEKIHSKSEQMSPEKHAVESGSTCDDTSSATRVCGS